ncbi:MAG TPA: acetyl-CoA C-acetyltransferase [Flavobacteriaceae bacterium]|nr:MAG: putative acetyl-CoA acyltransferase [Flavobacteriaceae bacterium]HCQ23597.1 acetyl-CoA C-acetyltransferase [Flavobacteriaceae bacterium]|tara:strand:+ start:95 stop:1264 length:1170 start_codon:yes stop_codon:yes gene_type:complete
MKNVVIVSAKRTPIGSFMGSLSTVPAIDLGAAAIKAALEAVSLDSGLVDEVLMGQVLQAGCGQAPARQAALKAGISPNVPCTTINKVCASGMKSIQLAAQSIALGQIEIAVTGGMENMSLCPHFVSLRKGTAFGSQVFEDSLERDGLMDAFDQVPMGVFADATAVKHGISRQEQDQHALQSYQRSAAAWEAGLFDTEVIPVSVPQRKGAALLVKKDEEYTKVTPNKIPLLRPAFAKDGTVTAANASTLNDGAAALVLMSEDKAQQLGIPPMARILSYADAAHDPRWFTTAPAKALPKALDLAQLEIEKIDWFEINEAFSVVGLANIKLLNLDRAKVNPNGGAVSLGHPLGCSGARIVVTLIHKLQQSGSYAAAGICNGGGGASALVLKK